MGRNQRGTALVVTDQYSPAIWDTSPNDLPFVVESSEEFPAERRELSYVTCGEKGADSQEGTIECVSEHHLGPFQRMQITGIGFLCLRNIATRTYAQYSRLNST